ncbi:MAG TPA: NAD(P)/FAD-dependent oxidoreductase [Pseudonocardia sp.]|jgi:cyclohexanone monooxygenase|nr:NAD(P)/FAD-dependent oxidoreductase [Pseudonocardia sp.]
MAESAAADDNPSAGGPDYDAVVVGAGFAGLRMLHELRSLGLTGRVLEAGSDVGGTWYWNRYPGARTDSESWVYCYSFDDALLQEWNWSARFPAGGEVLDYLRHVADRLDLRRDIDLETRVRSGVYDAETSQWTITTENGRSITCRYFIPATGFLSVAYRPSWEGLDDFHGEWYLTARWPSAEIDFDGKRVGVIGTGATAVQAIPEIAQNAEHLTVFQRTAQYVVPNRNHPLEEPQRTAIKRSYPEIWELCRRQVFGMPIKRTYRTIADVTPEEHRRILEAGWETGGFRFIFETLDDVVINAESNAAACEFVREKIRTIVNEPGTAELLCPYDHPIGAKRIPLGHHYYDTYNRENVTLVSVRDTPIERITPNGLRLEDGREYDLDVLVFATGFDAGTGALAAMDIRGREGRTVAEHWQDGARSYLGISVDGFPNMFMLTGPHLPLVNAPVLIEEQVQWVSRALQFLESSNQDAMEATPAAVAAYDKRLDELLDATLLRDAATVRSYYVGANIPGKPHKVLFYFGGATKYFKEIHNVATQDWDGFEFTKLDPSNTRHGGV